MDRRWLGGVTLQLLCRVKSLWRGGGLAQASWKRSVRQQTTHFRDTCQSGLAMLTWHGRIDSRDESDDLGAHFLATRHSTLVTRTAAQPLLPFDLQKPTNPLRYSSRAISYQTCYRARCI
jgi:hypothetical protein